MGGVLYIASSPTYITQIPHHPVAIPGITHTTPAPSKSIAKALSWMPIELNTQVLTLIILSEVDKGSDHFSN